jgi:hypothetical protein
MFLHVSRTVLQSISHQQPAWTVTASRKHSAQVAQMQKATLHNPEALAAASNDAVHLMTLSMVCCCREEEVELPPYVEIAQQMWDIIESGEGYTGNKPLAVPHNAYFKVCCACCA